MNLKPFNSKHKKLKPLYDRLDTIKITVLEIGVVRLNNELSFLINTVWVLETKLIGEIGVKYFLNTFKR